MSDLFDQSPLNASYSAIYKALSEMRELFHQTGRFDDSNAKLDEVVKLIATYLAFKRGLIEHFPKASADDRKLISELQSSFNEAKNLKEYRNQDGSSIFGAKASLLLRKGDKVLAKTLIMLVQTAVDAALTNKKLANPFDVLNEAFGHFVRDNFRSNIEDAQYMTPPEIVDFMVNIAIKDLVNENAISKGSFVLIDPTCGVGSFLTSFYHKAHSLPMFANSRIKLIGQDKVERMTRLTNINLALFEAVDHQITIGNSLSAKSPLSEFNGVADLILTNPPFGAKFSRNDVISFGNRNLPIFASLANKLQSIDSELLFVDRDMALLKEGGRLLIIVPDSVVSVRGLAALLRQRLKESATVRAVIELPSVAFAQAGTRTKTCILYLVKERTNKLIKSAFIAKSENLGYEVGTRKGVQVKISKGENDLPAILSAYETFIKIKSRGQTKIILESPSSVSVTYNEFIDNPWTPNHYNSMRYKAIKQLEKSSSVKPIPLSSLVDFVNDDRENELYNEQSLFVSVLHVISEGVLDIKGIESYKPKTPGIQVKPNDILFSKINPRIPRVFVMPDFGKKTLCSSEFEVMTPKKGVDPYLVAYLLLSDPVHDQIKSLTSGTSASHNRIKTQDLAEILLPMPKHGTKQALKVQRLIKDYRQSVQTMVRQTRKLADVKLDVDNALFTSH